MHGFTPSHAQCAVAEQTEAGFPKDRAQRVDVTECLRIVVLGDDRREAEDRRDRRAGLPQADGGFRVGEQDRFVDDGDLVTVIVCGWEAPAAVAEARVVIRLVDGLPSAREIAERLRHEVGVTSPGVRVARRSRGSRLGLRTSAAR